MKQILFLSYIVLPIMCLTLQAKAYKRADPPENCPRGDTVHCFDSQPQKNLVAPTIDENVKIGLEKKVAACVNKNSLLKQNQCQQVETSDVLVTTSLNEVSFYAECKTNVQIARIYVASSEDDWNTCSVFLTEE